MPLFKGSHYNEHIYTMSIYTIYIYTMSIYIYMSVHTKLIEMVIMPNPEISKNQLGFRPDRGASFGIPFLHDIVEILKQDNSPVFVCSLDAQKCFDTIWHDGLFYKLKDVLPHGYWLFLYRWYSCMNAVVRVGYDYSQVFPILQGARQGSVLSPTLFNVFINGLLLELEKMGTGIRLGGHHFGSFAYADDITLVSATVPGIQQMIDICTQYADDWRMLFNPLKSKCMIMGRNELLVEPSWYLKGSSILLWSFW